MENLITSSKSVRDILLDDKTSIQFNEWWEQNKDNSELKGQYAETCAMAEAVGFNEGRSSFESWCRSRWEDMILPTLKESKVKEKSKVSEENDERGFDLTPDFTLEPSKSALSDKNPIEPSNPTTDDEKDAKKLKKGDRPLWKIAQDIRKNWKNVHFAAKPYLAAMMQLDSIFDNYGFDSGKSVVLYFLANANTWRGERAKAIKKELKKLTNRK